MRHILVVEDEERMAETLTKGLEQAGYKVSVIINGREAKHEDISQYDLVLLDWMLPGQSGIEVLRYWRYTEKFITPIFILSAKNRIEDKVTGLQWGADDYISKFFEWPELLARIERHINRFNSYIDRLGPITFNRSEKLFYESTHRVELSKTEYKLLEFFFNNPTRALTRDEIIHHIYGEDKEPGSNVIERHIKSIRQKFFYDPITTIHNVGYRLKPQ